MRVLLDECINRRLGRDIVGHEVRTVPQMGWATIRNSDLLGLAEGQFGTFVTVDRTLAFQQDLPRFSIAGAVLRARTNRLADLRPLVPQRLEALQQAARGEVTWIGT